jgi:pimeloyl-ACP methyl ester carboxylesterase
MSPLIEGAGVALEFSESGEGGSVLLVHAIGGSSWPDLPGRVIAYARRGYGGSGAPEPYIRTTVEEQAEDAAALLSGLGAAPAVVVGDGLGALVGLDLARRHGALVRAAVAIDPPLFAFVPEAAEVLSRESDELERALREQGPAEAARSAMLAAGAGTELAASAAASYRGFFADYGAAAAWEVGRRELRALSVPVAVLAREGAPAHVVAAADALAGVVPGARRAPAAALPDVVGALLA